MHIRIRTRGLRLRPSLLSRIERRVRSLLEPYAARVGTVQITLTGRHRAEGAERVCRIHVRLPSAGEVVVTERHEGIPTLINRTARRAAAAIQRRIGRRRALRRRPRHTRPLMAAT